MRLRTIATASLAGGVLGFLGAYVSGGFEGTGGLLVGGTFLAAALLLVGWFATRVDGGAGERVAIFGASILLAAVVVVVIAFAVLFVGCGLLGGERCLN